MSTQLDRDLIRQIQLGGECYYCAIDVVAAILHKDRARAQTYYGVLKNRKKQDGVAFPLTIQSKLVASDGKKYLTDFIDAEGVKLLQSWLEPIYEKQKVRVEHRRDDEINNFHPIITSFLSAHDWEIWHHVELPSGRIIDIVAKHKLDLLIIECKPNLKGHNLYEAIGQVMCYRNEILFPALPIIATYESHLSDYARFHCQKLQIMVLEVVKPKIGAQNVGKTACEINQIRGYDLIIEKLRFECKNKILKPEQE